MAAPAGLPGEVMKSVVAQYDADHLLTQRDKVSREIRNQVRAGASSIDVPTPIPTRSIGVFGYHLAR